MAIRAAAVKCKVRSFSGRLKGTALVRRAGIAEVVALLAESRRARLQQLWIAGPMRLMAIHAVLHDRRMFPQERPASFGVALVAVVVGGGLNQLFGVGRPVRVVAA